MLTKNAFFCYSNRRLAEENKLGDGENEAICSEVSDSSSVLIYEQITRFEEEDWGRVIVICT